MSSESAVVLGVWDGHDASVALIADGRLVFALSEERPSRRKRHSGFPRRALARCLSWAADHGIRPTHTALAGSWGRAPQRLLEPLYARGDPRREPLGLASRAAMAWENRVAAYPALRRWERPAGLVAVRARLAAALGGNTPLHVVDHHEAHAFSALLGAPGAGALVITCDAYGEGVAATVRGADGPLRPAVRAPAPWGLPLLYGAVTVALGFAEGDEGKVTGLAARGDPERLGGRFHGLFREGSGPPALRRSLGRREIRALIRGASVEDVAAGLQECAEEQTERWIARLLDDVARPTPLLLAGGLFANVRINRGLARLPGLDGLFVFPHMGDGGLSVGAAHRLWFGLRRRLAQPWDGAALGRSFERTAARGAAERAGLSVRPVESASIAAARRLHQGRVVCRFTGRDEFGPRALGNRSILFSAADPGLCARVNRALGRDDSMPFGPVLADEDVGSALQVPAPPIDLAHMTVAVDATPAFRRECPGAVHVDGTARPQVVRRSRDPELHALLTAHRREGGGRALINTSFNLHGEPVVHTPEDAVRTFVASGLDTLYLGDLECSRRGS